MAGNVFGLNEVYDLQKDNATDLDLNIPGLGYGYAGQGYSAPGGSSTSCLLNRIEFSTETITAPPNQLTTKTDDGGGWSSENYGYFIGGYDASVPGYNCKITRLDFSNDTTSQPGRNLNEAKGAGSTVQTGDYGYYTGGGISGGHACSINRMDFSSETTTTISAGTNGKRLNCSDVQSSRYGYICGGIPVGVPNAELCTVDRLDFSVETISVNAGSLDFITQRAAGNLQDQDYGYVAGGSGGPPPTRSRLERVDFTTDAVTLMSEGLPALPAGVTWSSGVNSPDFGYWLGGQTSPAGPGATSVVNRLDFSTQTTSSPGGNMTAAGTWSNGGQVNANRAQVFKFVPGNSLWKESPNHGYYGGGYSGNFLAYSSTIDRLDFSSETTSNPPASLTQGRSDLATISNSSYSYFGGGATAPGARQCTIDRLDFSNETVVAPTTFLSQAKSQLAGTSSNSYGYFGGGQAPPNLCTIERLDFSNETVSNPPVSLTQDRRALAAVSNSSYGYYGGGNATPPIVCTIDRLDFSTETTTNPPASLTQDRRYLSATSSSSYGYFVGGGTPSIVCTIDRLDFSNETVTNPPASLTQARSSLGTISNSSYGYFGGGLDNSSSRVCTIDRLDFSTETVTVPGPQLTQARFGLAAVNGGIATRRVGKATYGYVAGGVAQPPGAEISTIDRFEFLTETVTNPAVIGKLSRAVQGQASFSSSEYGYFGGGYSPAAPGVSCLIDRLDFSNDTASQHSSSFQTTRLGAAGIQNANYGYAGGGQVPAVSCTIARLDFSTETVAQPNSYSMTRANRSHAAISGPSYGYFAGGLDSGGSRVCLIDRFDFTTETGDNPAFSLPTAVRGPGGTQNTNDGYFAGGDTPTAISNIFRLDFTTETLTTNPNNLSSAKSLLPGSSSGDGRYGYFYGGYNSISTIDRIEFDSGTVSTPSQKLTSAKYGPGSVANG